MGPKKLFRRIAQNNEPIKDIVFVFKKKKKTRKKKKKSKSLFIRSGIYRRYGHGLFNHFSYGGGLFHYIFSCSLGKTIGQKFLLNITHDKTRRSKSG